MTHGYSDVIYLDLVVTKKEKKPPRNFLAWYPQIQSLVRAMIYPESLQNFAIFIQIKWYILTSNQEILKFIRDRHAPPIITP